MPIQFTPIQQVLHQFRAVYPRYITLTLSRAACRSIQRYIRDTLLYTAVYDTAIQPIHYTSRYTPPRVEQSSRFNVKTPLKRFVSTPLSGAVETFQHLSKSLLKQCLALSVSTPFQGPRPITRRLLERFNTVSLYDGSSLSCGGRTL